jgi:hypothetical protein
MYYDLFLLSSNATHHKWHADPKELGDLALEILILVNLILGLLVLVCFGVRVIEFGIRGNYGSLNVCN